MKNVLKMILCLMLCMCFLTAASAQRVERAGKLLEEKNLIHYPSYLCDEETGKWSVHAYQADALLDRFWDYGSRFSSRTVVFHLAAEGDARTGVWTPVLRFYHIDGERISASAVSILVDGNRYDLAASSETAAYGRHTAECITVPLNRAGLQVVQAMSKAETVMLRLIGEEIYTLTVDRNATTERMAMEGASLTQLSAGLALLEELGAENYALWDLSAEMWKQEHGYAPAVLQGTAGEEIFGIALEDSMGMVLPEASGDAAEMVQEKLVEYGFLSGKPSRKMTDNAVQAVLRAQKVLDRVPTGCADEALLNALAAGRSVSEEETLEMLDLGSAAQIGLKRYWFADGVSAAAGTASLRTVSNADNVFLAADGLIRNLDAEELHLFMQAEASLVCNGRYAYEAEMVCECGNGTELDTRLLPMAQARLIVYAEIPVSLALDDAAQWSFAFELNGESLVIDLE